MKNRYRQRTNRKSAHELLGLRDICGNKDPTPFEAVKEIVRTSKKSAEQKGSKTTKQTKERIDPKPTETG